MSYADKLSKMKSGEFAGRMVLAITETMTDDQISAGSWGVLGETPALSVADFREVIARLRREFPDQPVIDWGDDQPGNQAAEAFFSPMCSWARSGRFGDVLRWAVLPYTRKKPFNFGGSIAECEIDWGEGKISEDISPTVFGPLLSTLTKKGFGLLEAAMAYGSTYEPLDLTQIDHRLLPIPDHVLAKSIKFDGLVAYFPDEEKLLANRRVALKPGKYLGRFYPFLTQPEIAEYAAKLGSPGSLHFADTPDDVEHVYTNGPSSCMSKPESYYGISEHPVRAYGGSPDLKLAYLKAMGGEITARALVWPDKKTVGRIYGDAQRLAPLLNAEGYECDPTWMHYYDHLDGARIRLIREGRAIVCPYIDGSGTVSESYCGKWLEIGGGDIGAGSTGGLIHISNPVEFYCPRLDEHFEFEDEDEMEENTVYVDGEDETWHIRAYNRYAAVCAHSGEAFDRDNMTEVYISTTTTRSWGDTYLDGTTWTCDGDGTIYSNSVADEPYLDALGNLLRVGPRFLSGTAFILIEDDHPNFDADANGGNPYWVDTNRFISPDQLALPLANAA